MNLSKQEWEGLDEEEFFNIFKGTPVMRTKYKGLRRNIDYLDP
jgi:epoxyqueuosine reductase